jgi:branched-chain amino acid transport system permease protein
MSMTRFILLACLVGAVTVACGMAAPNEYYVFAAFAVVQYIVIATAWNILGGYVGYVNFGTTAFLAMGLYGAAAINKFVPTPLPILMVAMGVICGLTGLGVGYLTIRLRGIYFAIATLALSVLVQTLVVNWDFVGGSRGLYIMRPMTMPIFGTYVKYLFFLIVVLAVGSVIIARAIERSKLGLGLSAVRDDEAAAAASGVPTLKLKLIATTLSGGLMGMAGAPIPFYLTYVEPTSSFSLVYTVNSIAMPLVGGTTMWIGPIIGAILLGTMQQAMTVLISSSLNLLIVGALLLAFVIAAPEGLIGLYQSWRRRLTAAPPSHAATISKPERKAS